MKKYSTTYKRTNLIESSQIENLKQEKYKVATVDKWFIDNKANEHFQPRQVDEWIRKEYCSYYVEKSNGQIEQYGVESIEVIPHEISYLSRYVADFKLYNKNRETYYIRKARYGFNGSNKVADKFPYIICILKSGEIETLKYDSIFIEDEIVSTISVYETVENKVSKNGKICDEIDLTFHINIDGKETTKIAHVINYGCLKDKPLYYWYSSVGSKKNRIMISIINIKTGMTSIFGEIKRLGNTNPGPRDKYLHITQEFNKRIDPYPINRKSIEKEIKLYFSKSVSIDFDVLFYYVTNNLENRIIPNICNDDPNVNYEVRFQSNDKESLSFILYMLTQRNVESVKVFDLNLFELYRYLTDSYEIEKNLVNMGEERTHSYKVVEKIINATKCESIEKLANLLADKYDLLNLLEDNKKSSYYTKRFRVYKLIEPVSSGEMFRRLLNEVTSKGLLNIRWKNEYKLYMLVHNYFEDTIFQYRNNWLGQQSLDIFIPSMRIGLEYQGIQHYQPIDIFGGEQSFEYRKSLDELKGKLCKKNNVILIHWPYTESVTIENLEKKFNSLGIKILS